MKKKVLAILLAATMTLSFAACGAKTPTSSSDAPVSVSKEIPQEATQEQALSAAEEAGFVNGKFTEKRHITVEVYDRDGKTPATDNSWTDWIKAQMLERYNVEVEYVAVPRWTETDEINNLLGAGTAPDICYTYSYATIQTYAAMDGVIDLAPELQKFGSLLTNMKDWLTDTVIYQDLDPSTGTLWAIEGKRNEIARINTFVRKDWLDKLNMAAPTNKAEFEAMLVAFRDNAELLLGKDASKMIPFSTSYDIGWRAANLIDSCIDPDITDKEYYVNGFDDRHFTQNGAKEAVKLLNKWYNDGLIWKDFALYGEGDTQEDDNIKAGFVGAFMHNYDYPFRGGTDSINYILSQQVGPEAKFIAVNCFEDKNGTYTKYSYPVTGDRKAFFPKTNDEVLASLLYLEFMSDPAVVEYLQVGDEGVVHTVASNGAYVIQVPDDEHIGFYQNSGKNIDLTINCNGLRLSTPELTNLSLAYSYAEVDPADVQKAIEAALVDARAAKVVSAGDIAAEAEASGLTNKRDQAFDNAVVASVADFDAVWDKGISEYLAAGGQDIIDERSAAWERTYGSETMLP